MPSRKRKKFIVLPRNQRISEQGLTTGQGHRTFGDKNAMWISDPAEAQEIETQYGMKGTKEVAVTTDQQYEWSVNNDGQNGTRSDNIHHYTQRMKEALPNRVHPRDDPNWEEFSPGRWRPKSQRPKKQRKASRWPTALRSSS